MIKYNPSGYKNYIRMSKMQHLLVEGKDDKQFFKLLLNELLPTDHESSMNINIDIAEDLIEFEQVFGNREKVEKICEGMEDNPKLTGFVDREFRDFNIRDCMIQDELADHRMRGRLVWSRGHSVENYFFDFTILRNPLHDLSAVENFDNALDLFEHVFDQSIKMACAVSLVGREFKKIKVIKDIIHCNLIEINSSSLIEIKFEYLKSKLKEKKIPTDEIDQIIKSLKDWISEIENNIDLQNIRWCCHGHIGMSFIWAVYSQCVVKTCTGSSEQVIASMYGVKERNRFHAIASHWAREVFNYRDDLPIKVFELLGIAIP